MITDDYVNFEIAKLLKEKEFNGECRDYYNTDGHFYSEDFKTNWNDDREGIALTLFSAPTLQMVMKWLREVHKVEVRVSYDIDKTTWWGGCKPMYEENEENSNMFQSLLGFDCQSKTYEEACEAAIKYCLENLI